MIFKKIFEYLNTFQEDPKKEKKETDVINEQQPEDNKSTNLTSLFGIFGNNKKKNKTRKTNNFLY